MPYVNGKYYESQKEKQAILDSQNPAKNKTSSSPSKTSSASAVRPSSGGSSYSSSGSSSSRSGSSGSSSKTASIPGGALGLVGALVGGTVAGALKNKTGGGSSSSGSRGSSSGSSYSGGYASDNRDYHQEAINAAAQGDWAKVSQALAARQAKINAQGGNDRGVSNAQILANLQNQYRGSYNALPSSVQNTLGMAASGQLNGRGWEDGHDYLAEAQNYARAGDMEAAYDALRRRGFKMYDTGSNGGGTSQDQAYAIIQRLFDQGSGGAAEQQRAMADNARLLAEHPTPFGPGTNPSLANKHFVSADNRYIIYYDAAGTPVRAIPNSASAYRDKYSDEYIDLLSRYYGGTEDYADTRRQLHNLDVVRTGNGRLIDQNWNWASGAAAGPESAWDWQNQPANINQNVGQDKDLLANILAKINQGQSFSSPTQVPITRRYVPPAYETGGSRDDLAPSGSSYGSSKTPASSGGGNGLVSSSGQYGTPGGTDLTEYIRQMYQQNLAAQLAGLQASYEQSAAAYKAQGDRIARLYQDQRNQAAAENDLQRLYMAELGNYQGLNTGATGQLALAQGQALQDSLSGLGAAENQDLSSVDLALNQLLTGYRGSVDAATAQSGADLAQALYGEYVRQLQAEEAARQAAQAQANWEAQFNYQTQQDAADRAFSQQQLEYSQQKAALDYQYQLAQLEAAANKQNASNAWDYAQLLLKNGVMPDESTLYMAGLDATSAQALADSYKWQLGQKYAPKSSGSSSGGSRSSGASDNYMGSGAYESAYGSSSAPVTASGGGGGMNSSYFNAMGRSLSTALEQGRTDAIASALDGVWNTLSASQQQQIQALLARYNTSYQP